MPRASCHCPASTHPRVVALVCPRASCQHTLSPNTQRSWDPHVLRCTITMPLAPPWNTDLFNRSTQEPRRVSLHRRLVRPNGRNHARGRPRLAPEGRRDFALPQCRGIQTHAYALQCTQGGEGWVLERSPRTVYTGWVQKCCRVGIGRRAWLVGCATAGLERSPDRRRCMT